jgi:hypothetical protein
MVAFATRNPFLRELVAVEAVFLGDVFVLADLAFDMTVRLGLLQRVGVAFDIFAFVLDIVVAISARVLV